MNRNRKPLEKRMRKKIDKEIRSAQSEYAKKDPLPNSDQLRAEEMLKKYPKKTIKAEKGIIASTKKNFEIKKKKEHSSHHSKRTTPGEVMEQDATPAHAHAEGQRWQKLSVKQSVNRGQAMKRKLSKKK